MNDEPYRLYRYFDSRRWLLYVGISGDLARRDGTHISRSRWMQFTARSSVERHKTLEGVKEAERTAIESERPIFNKLHNSAPEAKRRLRAYLEAAGRLDLLPPEPEARTKHRVVFGATHPILLGGTFREWRGYGATL
jgi:predicted GIY-YIG superfamily endonuclease